MNHKQQIENDLKAAMLAGEKAKVDALRLLKSAILDAEVTAGARDSGLDEDALLKVLAKEAKKRHESIRMYEQNTEGSDAAAQEKYELSIIDAYLPEAVSEDELVDLVRASMKAIGASSMKDMGAVIQRVKQHTGPGVDGAKLAGLVKKELA